MTQNAVAQRVDQLPVAPAASESAAILSVIERMAMNPDIDPERVERFIALKRQMDADAARRAFNAAMSDAKAEIPVILKNRQVGYEHKSGDSSTEYRHEDLGQIARTVDPILTKFGLSYRFRTTSAPNEPVSVTCIVAHRDGHSEENTLTAGRDDSGKKNNIQAVGSTITYLQRYTLKAALGLAAAADDDAKSSEAKDTLSEDQVEEIKTLIDRAVAVRPDTSHADWIASFLEFMKAESLNAIPARDFGKAKTNIQNAIKQGAK